MNSESVRLIENFVTWQGEGPDSGRSMILLRFKTCNLKCPWCDTSVRMRVSSESNHSLSDIQQSINENRAGLLITGGEPTVERHFGDTVKLLNELDYPVANVETNGYNLEKLLKSVRQTKNVKFIYSPKIFSSEDWDEVERVTKNVVTWKNVYFKLVWTGDTWNNVYCEWLLSEIKGRHAQNNVWLMPEGSTREDLLRNSPKVFDACEKFKFHFSSRDHIIYGFI